MHNSLPSAKLCASVAMLQRGAWAGVGMDISAAWQVILCALKLCLLLKSFAFVVAFT